MNLRDNNKNIIVIVFISLILIGILVMIYTKVLSLTSINSNFYDNFKYGIGTLKMIALMVNIGFLVTLISVVLIVLDTFKNKNRCKLLVKSSFIITTSLGFGIYWYMAPLSWKLVGGINILKSGNIVGIIKVYPQLDTLCEYSYLIKLVLMVYLTLLVFTMFSQLTSLIKNNKDII